MHTIMKENSPQLTALHTKLHLLKYEIYSTYSNMGEYLEDRDPCINQDLPSNRNQSFPMSKTSGVKNTQRNIGSVKDLILDCTETAIQSSIWKNIWHYYSSTSYKGLIGYVRKYNQHLLLKYFWKFKENWFQFKAEEMMEFNKR